MFDAKRCIPSKEGNVWKYVHENNSDRKAVAESVLYRYPTFEERTVMCISTQSGCPVGCRFCGAGDAFVRSLDAHEIVAQVTHMLADKDIEPLQIKKFQIMFMSMGEPMLNFDALAQACRKLNRLYPHARLLVSTSAPRVDYVPMQILSQKIPEIGLQFSVHESTDDARNRLVPFKAKLSLEEIAVEGVAWHMATGRRPFFNYCAHPGNTSQQDVDRLKRLFDPDVWECTISVICERDESVSAANARQRQLAVDFRAKMGKAGFSTRVFDPAGQDDIGGGCGQLWFVQDWMRKNGARKSIGHGLPVVHTPT